jgi:hypothetical protein
MTMKFHSWNPEPLRGSVPRRQIHQQEGSPTDPPIDRRPQLALPAPDQKRLLREPQLSHAKSLMIAPDTTRAQYSGTCRVNASRCSPCPNSLGVPRVAWFRQPGRMPIPLPRARSPPQLARLLEDDGLLSDPSGLPRARTPPPLALTP